MRATGLRTMLGVHWRTHRSGTLVWILALIASMVGTAAAVAGLYTTPEKIHTYAAAVTTGSALVAINGKVEGIDSLGGVIQDESGFLMAILVTALAFTLGLTFCGVPAARSALYAASLAGLAFVFAGLAALVAQVTRHSRGVYAWSLLVLAVAYLLRGVGDVTKTWVTWLSPLGWAEKAAPFGPMRWWTLLVPLAVGGLLSALAVLIAGRRDLGSSLVRGRPGSARASTWLRSPVGLATYIHSPVSYTH